MKMSKNYKRISLLIAIFIAIFFISVDAAEKKTKKAAEKAAPPAAEQPKASPSTPAETPSAAPSTEKTLDPKSAKSLIYLDTKGEMAGTGDINKSGVASTFAKIGAGWHPTALAESGLPMDKYKLVDWAKVVKEKIIDPRFDLDPAVKPDDEQILDMNILFETKSDFMDNVIFPHFIHTWWLKCEVCHASVGGPIFEPVAGGNDVKMSEMAGGKWCGRCHNKIAFPLADCKRCHTFSKKNKPDDTITVRAVSK
jgi:c(7)-type cytochrome triheme protein